MNNKRNLFKPLADRGRRNMAAAARLGSRVKQARQVVSLLLPHCHFVVETSVPLDLRQRPRHPPPGRQL